MEIRHLRYFLAVADTLNFGVAARQLHMSQPPLSKRIAEFEQQIGAPLFVRSTRHVTLSDTGQALLPHARSAVQAFDAAVQAANLLVQQQSSRRLRIAFPAETSRDVLVSTTASLLSQGVHVDVMEASTAEQMALLAAAEVDIGVVRHPFEMPALLCGSVLRQTLGILLHVDHPLAVEKALHLGQLQPYPLVIFPPNIAPRLYDHLLLLCRQGGYAPARIVHGLRMTLGMLVAESGVAFFTQDGAKRLFGDTAQWCWKAIIGDTLYWCTSVVARKDNPHAAIARGMTLITHLLQQYDGWVVSTFPYVSGR